MAPMCLAFSACLALPGSEAATTARPRSNNNPTDVYTDWGERIVVDAEVTGPCERNERAPALGGVSRMPALIEPLMHYIYH